MITLLLLDADAPSWGALSGLGDFIYGDRNDLFSCLNRPFGCPASRNYGANVAVAGVDLDVAEGQSSSRCSGLPAAADHDARTDRGILPAHLGRDLPQGKPVADRRRSARHRRRVPGRAVPHMTAAKERRVQLRMQERLPPARPRA